MPPQPVSGRSVRWHRAAGNRSGAWVWNTRRPQVPSSCGLPPSPGSWLGHTFQGHRRRSWNYDRQDPVQPAAVSPPARRGVQLQFPVWTDIEPSASAPCCRVAVHTCRTATSAGHGRRTPLAGAAAAVVVSNCRPWRSLSGAVSRGTGVGRGYLYTSWDTRLCLTYYKSGLKNSIQKHMHTFHTRNCSQYILPASWFKIGLKVWSELLVNLW